MTHEQLQLADDIKGMMSTESGRRFIHWMIWDVGCLQADDYDSAIKDGICAALHQARFNGRRSMAIELHNTIQEAAPGSYLDMLQEAAGRAQAALREEIVT